MFFAWYDKRWMIQNSKFDFLWFGCVFGLMPYRIYVSCAAVFTNKSEKFVVNFYFVTWFLVKPLDFIPIYLFGGTCAVFFILFNLEMACDWDKLNENNRKIILLCLVNE